MSTAAHDQALQHWLLAQLEAHDRPLLLGICGAQGSGKSTLARQLAGALQAQGLKLAVVSLDDLYLSRARRRQLASSVHPLLATRGVPGTHDVDFGIRLMRQLRQLAAGESLPLPRFDKATDDPYPQSAWPVVTGPLDLILFEGWCIGVPPQADEALASPVNALEQTADADGHWRGYVNQQLATAYSTLFAELDRLIFLQIPDWSAVMRWRSQQEAQTARQSGGGAALMDQAELARFIQHYERLSRHALRCMPARCDVLRRLGPEHQVLDQRISAGG